MAPPPSTARRPLRWQYECMKKLGMWGTVGTAVMMATVLALSGTAMAATSAPPVIVAVSKKLLGVLAVIVVVVAGAAAFLVSRRGK